MTPLDDALVPAPDMARILAAALAAPAQDYSTMTPAEARAVARRNNEAWNKPVPALARVEDLDIPGPAGRMRGRLYLPRPGARLPAILFLHGGGWVVCDIDTHDRTMRLLALETGAAVLGIDYRLAPEHPFPGPLDDCLAAARWLAQGGAGDAVDPARLAVAGDSAGANLALAVLITARDAGGPKLRSGALFYGCYEPDFATESHARLGDGRFVLTTAQMRWFWRCYLGPLGETTTSLAAPSRARLAGLPPLYLCAAGLDPLRDDTLILAQRLAREGAPYRLDAVPGVIHGYIKMTSHLPAARASMREAARHLSENLSPTE